MKGKFNDDIILSKIYFMRREKVMVDSDLAVLYNVSTSRLNEQVKRNIKRFPKDFMFQLTRREFENLKSQNAISSWGGRRTSPYVFTEHGAVMLAGILNSEIAIAASINVVRVFIKLRRILSSYKELAEKVSTLEDKYEKNFKIVFELIQQLIKEEDKPKREIGFQLPKKT
ncbi:MAG: ORF6N domain-containing protein [Ignavibacteria bacterium]